MNDLAFDRSQFDPAMHGGIRPVSRETQISFTDYSRMHTFQPAKPFSGRRSTPPEWAVRDDLLRVTLVRYMERRAAGGGIRSLRPQPGTLRERLQRAIASIDAQVAHRRETLARLCREYVALKNRPGRGRKPRRRLRQLEVQIENLDTLLRFTEKLGGAGTILRVVHLYWRCGLDSVAVGQLVGLRPPHVRQLVYGMSLVWKNSSRSARIRRRRKPRVWKCPSAGRASTESPICSSVHQISLG